MKTLLVILGPTGVGKTDLCIEVAKALGIPIINADSRQIYRDLPIGTAAPTRRQMSEVPHYFVGTLALEGISVHRSTKKTLCGCSVAFSKAAT